MVTIIDVAKYVGVSKSTVSSVLNDDPRVKEETRARVLAAIEELGYVRNPNALGLRKRETKTIGVIAALERKHLPRYESKYEDSRYIYDVSNGIMDALTGSGYSVITERYSPQDADGEIPSIVKNARVDGLILIGGLFHDNIIEKIRGYGIPTVGIYINFDAIDTVNPDNVRSTYLAAAELLKNGCRNVVLLNSPERFATSQPRIEGWNRALAKYQAPGLRHIEVPVEATTGGGGYLAMKELWEQGYRPDGITASGETVALGAMRYLAEQGVRVPQDVSITAIGSSDLSVYCIPPLTCVDIHRDYMGQMAVELLLKRIQEPEAPIEQRVISPTLLRRNSVRQADGTSLQNPAQNNT